MLADDHTMVVEAFRKLLEPHCEVVGTVTNGRELLEAAPRFQPDVVVIDISMPLLNGLEAGRQLKAKMPAVKLIFLTMNEDPEVAIEAMRSGASAYLLKKCAASELFQAVRDTMKGRRYISPQIARGMQNCHIPDPRGGKRPRKLTSRQLQVVQLLAKGMIMKEAADALKVTPRTVAFHKYRVMHEFGLKTTAELIQFAIKTQIVEA
jgi:DNA-binding NarL/FixJ family response regulator